MPKDQNEIFSKIRGVSEYQPATAWCKRGGLLQCVREPQNKHDPNAIRLSVYGGLIFKKHHTLGYLSADLAERYAPLMDRGLAVRVLVSEVTGKKRGKTRGVNILITHSKSHAEQIKKDISKEKAIARARQAKHLRELEEQRIASAEAKRAKREQQKEQLKAGAIVVGSKFKRGFMKMIDPGPSGLRPDDHE